MMNMPATKSFLLFLLACWTSVLWGSDFPPNIKFYTNDEAGNVKTYAQNNLFSEEALVEAQTILEDIEANTGMSVNLAIGEFYFTNTTGKEFEEKVNQDGAKNTLISFDGKAEFVRIAKQQHQYWLPALLDRANQDFAGDHYNTITLAIAVYGSNYGDGLVSFEGAGAFYGVSIEQELRERVKYSLEACNKIKIMGDLDENNNCLGQKIKGLVDICTLIHSSQNLFSISLCIDNDCNSGSSNTIALISSFPFMPEISFTLEYYGPDEEEIFDCTSLEAVLRITYERETAVNSRNRNDLQIFSIPKIGFGYSYTFNTANLFQGGRAELLIIDDSGNELASNFFSIKALNPTANQVYTYIDNSNYETVFWFLKRIVTHENGAHPRTLSSKLFQFNEFNAEAENLLDDWDAYSRCPLLSSNRDGGWGLAQLTLPVPRSKALWSWKTNIDDAYNLLVGKAISVRNRTTNWVTTAERWNLENPGDTVVWHEDYEHGGITWVHAVNNYFENNTTISNYFPNRDFAENEKSFLDAMIIKTYNGLGGGAGDTHFYHLIGATRGENGEISKPYWSVDPTAHYGGGVNYYVRSISRTNIPTN